MPRRSRATNTTQRNRNLHALHCAMVRLAGIAGQDVDEFKRDWLRERFNVEHSTQLEDRELWEALDDANGKRPIYRDPPTVAREQSTLDHQRSTAREYAKPHKPWGARGNPGEAITTAQIRKVYSLAKERYGAYGYQERLRGFVMRQTGRTNKVESMTVAEGQSIIGAFLGQRVKSGLKAADDPGAGVLDSGSGQEQNDGIILTFPGSPPQCPA